MKKINLLIITLIVLLALIISIILFLQTNKNKDEKYFCNSDLDCVSQCSNGCVNTNWAISNPDTSECFRAWECSCVNKQCYTDGKPRN